VTEHVDAKLVAGPFDGDEGRVKMPLPETVWAFACGNAARACRFGGIHWLRTAQYAPPSAAVYERGPVDNGVQVYVYRDLRLQSHDKDRLETPAPELEPA
jgi:hypothetical protein